MKKKIKTFDKIRDNDKKDNPKESNQKIQAPIFVGRREGKKSRQAQYEPKSFHCCFAKKKSVYCEAK